MRINLPGQMEIPIQATHVQPTIPIGSKEQLAVHIARLLTKYESQPSSSLWIEIQVTAQEILK